MQTKKGKIILVFSVVILLIGLISAISTDIKIKTMLGQEVSVAIGEGTGEGNNWKFFKKTSDEYGDAVFSIPVNTDEYDLIITIKKDGELVKHPSFDNPYKSYGEIAGESITLELYPDWFTPPESPLEETEVVEENLTETEEVGNETIGIEEVTENETGVAQEKIDDNKELTGSSVSEGHASSSKTFYYGSGFIILLMISFVSFLAVKKMSVVKRKKGKEKLDTILDEMDAKGKPKKKKRDLVEDVKKKMKDIEKEMEELKGN